MKVAAGGGDPAFAVLRPAGFADQVEDVFCGRGDIGAGAEDRLDARIIKKLVILLRNDAAADHQNFARACGLQGLDQFWRQGFIWDPRNINTFYSIRTSKKKV